MRVRAVEGLPEIEPGDDIATLLEELDPPAADDIVVIASTIVSKAEGRIRALAEYEPSDHARDIAERFGRRQGTTKDPRFAQAILDESEELLIEDPFLLTVTSFGHICVNAGIDRTNVGPNGELLLLPADPMDSAARIRAGLQTSPPVIISDTCGRPFRHGQRGVAIGWAGMPPTRDWRGSTDRDGHQLEVTVEAVADELASSANLVTGEADEGLPVAYIEEWYPGAFSGGTRLFRSVETDFVRQALRDWQYENRD